MRQIVFFVFITVFLISCQEYLERDIANETVVLNSPPKGIHSTDYTQIFWWGEVDGASSYRLQAVSPSFSYSQKLWLDTIVNTNKFSYTFSPDSITWRVKALNVAYETEFAESYFVIDSSPKPQKVNLISPGLLAYLNSTSVEFSWSKSINATFYYFSILVENDEIFSTTTIDNKIILPNTGLNYPEIEDGNYIWTVYAGNQYGNSDAATQRSLVIDRVAPKTPTINYPGLYDTISDFRLAWEHPSNSGSPLMDSIIVLDSTGSSQLVIELVTDTVYNDYSPVTNGSYLFKVKTIDYAGNESGWCNSRRFFYKKEE